MEMADETPSLKDAGLYTMAFLPEWLFITDTVGVTTDGAREGFAGQDQALRSRSQRTTATAPRGIINPIRVTTISK